MRASGEKVRLGRVLLRPSWSFFACSVPLHWMSRLAQRLEESFKEPLDLPLSARVYLRCKRPPQPRNPLPPRTVVDEYPSRSRSAPGFGTFRDSGRWRPGASLPNAWESGFLTGIVCPENPNLAEDHHPFVFKDQLCPVIRYQNQSRKRRFSGQ